MKGISSIFKDPFYKLTRKVFFVLIGAIIATKLTAGAFGVVILAVGLWGALTRKPAYALICFCLLPFMTIMNPIIFGFGSLLGYSARLGMPVLTLAMIVSASSRPGRFSIPLLSMFGYVAVAIVSSINGYAPMISYFKIINFVLFFVGIYVGTKNLDKLPRDLLLLRAFFLAFAVFIVLGSFVVNYTNPFAAHYSAYGWHMAAGGTVLAQEAMAETIATTGEAGFLCGIVNHSQCLGPTTTCIAGWLLCDMLFVEKRVMPGHLLTLLLCPVVLYMTKSRTSLLGFVVMLLLVTMYCVPKFRVPAKIKRQLKSMTTTFFLLMVLGAIMLEVSSGGISKWLMKYDSNVNQSEEITVDAMMATRKGKIEEGLDDFRANPMFGKGFQVSAEHQYLANQGGLVLTAPIEKGFIPTMILGETGVAGAITFLIFLVVFYGGCISKGYWTTLALFTVYLSTNLGEATFFSPGGTGGPQWLYSLAGGFVIDVAAIQRKKLEQMGLLMRGR